MRSRVDRPTVLLDAGRERGAAAGHPPRDGLAVTAGSVAAHRGDGRLRGAVGGEREEPAALLLLADARRGAGRRDLHASPSHPKALSLASGVVPGSSRRTWNASAKPEPHAPARRHGPLGKVKRLTDRRPTSSTVG